MMRVSVQERTRFYRVFEALRLALPIQNCPAFEVEALILAVLSEATGFPYYQEKMAYHQLGLIKPGNFEGDACLDSWEDEKVGWLWELQNRLARRRGGYPLQYLTGVQYFFQHWYRMQPGVFIPRPETEQLVALAIQRLGPQPLLGLEIGLGSGIISIELLSHFPNLNLISTEINPQAGQLALLNAKTILKSAGVSDRLQWIPAANKEDLNQALGQDWSVDCLFSNPPYLRRDSSEVEEAVLKYEPAEALFPPDQDDFYFYRKLSHLAQEKVRPGGWVFLEIPHQRAHEIRSLFDQAGGFVEIFFDFNFRERVLVFQKLGSK